MVLLNEKDMRRAHLSSLRPLMATLLFLLVASCATKAPLPGGPKDECALSTEEQMRYDNFFLEAIRQYNLENYASAYDLAKHGVEIDSCSSELYNLLGRLNVRMERDTAAYEYFKKAATISPKNADYLTDLLSMSSAMGKKKETQRLLEQIYALKPGRTELLPLLLRFYQEDKDYAKQLEVIEKMEQALGESESLTLEKVNIYASMGDKEKAYAVLRKQCADHPDNVDYVVMMGNWLLNNDKAHEALEAFKQAGQSEPDNAFLLSSLSDYYKQMKDTARVDSVSERLLMSKNVEMEMKLQYLANMAKSVHTKADSTKMLDVLGKITRTFPKNGELAAFNATYMKLANMPSDTVCQALEKVVQLMPDDVSARINLLYELASSGGSWRKILEVAKAGTEYTPEAGVLYYFMAVSYLNIDGKDSDKALMALRKGVDRLDAEEYAPLLSTMYEIIGNLLYEKKEVKEAIDAFERSLSYNPENIECLNNYAYYLSENGGDLEKARKMSLKTIQAAPTNAVYLDTYAWILFQQKKYSEARKYLEMLLEADDKDTTMSEVVLEHAGDIYAKNGMMEKALHFWKKALDKGKDDKVLKKKIRSKKYVSK